MHKLILRGGALTTLFIGLLAILVTLNFNRTFASVPGNNTLISSVYSSPASTSANGAQTNANSMSGDGRYVVFGSSSTNLTSQYSQRYNVFVRDTKTNTTSIVSKSSSSVAEDADSTPMAISNTGRYVIFGSNATNLIDGTTVSGTYTQIYLRDTNTNTTTLLSKNSSGTPANASVYGYKISSDGRFVLMASQATNLDVTVTHTGTNLYMLDRNSGTFSLINLDYNGAQVANVYTNPDMSCDGSMVVFDSQISLTSASSGHTDVYLLDRRAGNKLVDVTATANGSAVNPHISCNGDYIGFSSYSNNLDSDHLGEPQYYHDYVYNRIDGTFTIVDQSTSGTAATVNTYDPYAGGYKVSNSNMAISNNGVVVFGTDARNLDPAATDGTYQLYVRDLHNNTTELLSKNIAGDAANGMSSGISVSDDGRIASYYSMAYNLTGSADSNGYNDVFSSQTGI